MKKYVTIVAPGLGTSASTAPRQIPAPGPGLTANSGNVFATVTVPMGKRLDRIMKVSRQAVITKGRYQAVTGLKPARTRPARAMTAYRRQGSFLIAVGINLLILLLLAAAPSAWAHAFLAGASPPVGIQLPAAPPELTLRFTEPIESLFSSVELRDAAGAAIQTDPPRLAAGTTHTLVVKLPTLRPGTYTVIWRATSVDTHKTEGRYQFTIGP